MRQFVFLISVSFFWCVQAFSQQMGAGHTSRPSCVILKRMGPADEVTSHLYSFGIRGKQFQYVEGKLPEGAPFHGRLTDHDVRGLQSRGAEVIVLEPHYTSDDLARARADCDQEGSIPSKQATKAEPALESAQQHDSASASGAVAKPRGQVSDSNQLDAQTTLEITSAPTGAEIELDGSFVGNTPSTVSVAQGEHTVKLTKSGYNEWQRKVKTISGNVKISPELNTTSGAAK